MKTTIKTIVASFTILIAAISGSSTSFARLNADTFNPTMYKCELSNAPDMHPFNQGFNCYGKSSITFRTSVISPQQIVRSFPTSKGTQIVKVTSAKPVIIKVYELSKGQANLSGVSGLKITQVTKISGVNGGSKTLNIRIPAPIANADGNKNLKWHYVAVEARDPNAQFPVTLEFSR